MPTDDNTPLEPKHNNQAGPMPTLGPVPPDVTIYLPVEPTPPKYIMKITGDTANVVINPEATKSDLNTLREKNPQAYVIVKTVLEERRLRKAAWDVVKKIEGSNYELARADIARIAAALRQVLGAVPAGTPRQS